jgi:peptidoglycan-associated lipoprotein
MKAIGFGTLMALGLALTLTTGCNPENLKNIPGRAHPMPVDKFAGPIIPNTPPIDTNMTKLPDEPGHINWLEDREPLKDYTVHFAYDSAAVPSADKSKLASVAEYLKKNPQAAVRVEGNCDERGTDGYNLSLGERRALAGREELIRQGIASERVDTLSYGENRPAVEGHNESAWTKNRRDDFVVLTPPK